MKNGMKGRTGKPDMEKQDIGKQDIGKQDTEKQHMEMKKNDIFEMDIVEMSEEGEGIGKIEGYTLFVKDTVIGDRARV